MIKHIILWQLKDELSGEEELKVKEGIKKGLEGLIHEIPGIIEIKVQTAGLSTSNADIMLDSTFQNQDALESYAVHPAHVEVANRNVRPFTKTRMCMDFEI